MEEIIFTVTLKSEQGFSVFRQLEELNVSTFDKYIPRPEWVTETKEQLICLGFCIEASSEVGITASGTKEMFEERFQTKVEKKKVKGIRSADYYTYEFLEEMKLPSELEFVEKITLPRQMFVLNEMIQPDLPYFHYHVPEDVKSLAKEELLLGFEHTDHKCKVGIIDTGLYHHAFFKTYGYQFQVIPAISSLDVTKDERGHGTGMSSVLCSLAGNSSVTMIKACNLNYSYPVAAMQKASECNFDVLNCSWGVIGFEPQLYLEILNLRRKQTIVVFSAGNGATDRKKSIFQTVASPDVISVGGCMVDEKREIEVSDISSSYWSDIFKERHVPDLCGICGKLPYAQIILMPIEPGALFDVENGRRDGTKQDDGWFVSSGTSAAAAYVSGIIAKILFCGLCTKEEVKNVLFHSAKSVNKGKTFMGDEATDESYDLATGHGFLDFEGILQYMRQVQKRKEVWRKTA